MTNHTRTLPLALAAAALLAVPACGFTVSTSTPATTPPSTAPSTTTPAPSPVARPVETVPPLERLAAEDPDEVPTLDEAAEMIRPFLLTPAEVGEGYTAGEEPLPDPAQPAICGGPGVVAQFPIAVRVGARYLAPTPGVEVTETVSVYGDAAEAQAAFGSSVAGMDCSEGTVGDQPVVLAPVEDLTVDVGGEQATGWYVGGDGFDVVIVAVQDGEVVWNFTFLAAGDTWEQMPEPLEVAAAGVEKLSD